MADTIELRGLEPIMADLRQLQKLSFVNAVLMAGAVYLQRKVATYPPRKRPTRKSVYGRTFESDKQRYWFFGALAKGKIDVPYRRGISPGSQTLGKRWTVASQSPLVVVLGNNASYGPLVQSLQDQTLYMRAVGWVPIETTLEREESNVLRYMEREMNRELKSLGAT